jgi:hypothetical protein
MTERSKKKSNINWSQIGKDLALTAAQGFIFGGLSILGGKVVNSIGKGGKDVTVAETTNVAPLKKVV